VTQRVAVRDPAYSSQKKIKKTYRLIKIQRKYLSIIYLVWIFQDNSIVRSQLALSLFCDHERGIFEEEFKLIYLQGMLFGI